MKWDFEELKMRAEEMHREVQPTIIKKGSKYSNGLRKAKLDRILTEAKNLTPTDACVANIWDNRWYLFHRHVIGLQVMKNYDNVATSMDEATTKRAIMAGDLKIVDEGKVPPQALRYSVVWHNPETGKMFVFSRFNGYKAFNKLLLRMIKLEEAKKFNSNAEVVFKEEHKLVSANSLAMCVLKALQFKSSMGEVTEHVNEQLEAVSVTLETIASYKELHEVMTTMNINWAKLYFDGSELYHFYTGVAKHYVDKLCKKAGVVYEEILENLDAFEIPQNMDYMI